jgi:hypothetical protein
MNRQDALARVANIKKQLAQLSEKHRKALDASDWATCMKLQDQIARKMDEVIALTKKTIGLV